MVESPTLNQKRTEMARREDYDWKSMSDERLEERLLQEQWKSAHKNKRVDRAIARKNVEAIYREMTRRYEEKFFD